MRLLVMFNISPIYNFDRTIQILTSSGLEPPPLPRLLFRLNFQLSLFLRYSQPTFESRYCLRRYIVTAMFFTSKCVHQSFTNPYSLRIDRSLTTTESAKVTGRPIFALTDYDDTI
jgi:hypothetical protein